LHGADEPCLLAGDAGGFALADEREAGRCVGQAPGADADREVAKVIVLPGFQARRSAVAGSTSRTR
jgi:hypothetical protein